MNTDWWIQSGEEGCKITIFFLGTAIYGPPWKVLDSVWKTVVKNKNKIQRLSQKLSERSFEQRKKNVFIKPEMDIQTLAMQDSAPEQTDSLTLF